MSQLTFAGVKINGQVINSTVQVRRDVLRRILVTEKVRIVRTVHATDDTGEQSAPKEFSVEEFLPELEDKPTLSYYDIKGEKIRYCPSRRSSFDITLKESETILLGVLSTKDVPVSIRIRQRLRELEATTEDIFDCIETMLGMIYKKHKEENVSLVKVQEGLREIQERISKKVAS